MRKLAFAFILVGLSLIAGSVFLHLKTGSLGPAPEAVARLERTLARPGLVALATLNVRALVDLDVIDPPAGDDDGMLQELAAAGIDVRRDVSHATVALSARADGEPRATLGLFGRFDPSALASRMRELEVIEVLGGGSGDTAGPFGGQHRDVLHFNRIDPETCEPTGPWAAHLASDRILIAHADEIDALVGGADASDGAMRDLTRFQDFRGSQLVSAAVFVPDELPATGNPFVAMAAQGAAAQIEGFRALYAGASPRMMPPGLDVDALLEAVDAGVAAEKATAWQQAIASGRAGLAKRLPTLATVLDALSVRAEGNDLFAELRLGSDEIERLRDLPAEIGAGLFGGGGMQLTASGEAPPEQIDDSPLAFLPEASSAKLAPYDPGVTFAGKVDHTRGPFGVRIVAMRLGAGGGPAEIDVEAFATGVPNLGDRGERAEIVVTSIESHEGEELLAAEHCGSDRNDEPAPMVVSFAGDVLNGTKTLRLREGATPNDVGRIEGTARIRLPVKTESVRVPAKGDQSAERAGAKVALSRGGGGSISYEVSGEDAPLLHLRARNAAGKPLSRSGSTSMGAFFGGGESGTMMFSGDPHEVELVFALEEELVEYPFTLEGARPGTDGEMLAMEQEDEDEDTLVLTGALEKTLARLADDVISAVDRAVGADGAPVAREQTGPFLVSLEGIWSFGGLMPRIEVRAPGFAGLTESPNAVELRLDEMRMQDGEAITGGWSEVVSMGSGFGREGLVGTAQLSTGARGDADAVESLHGAVVVRLPSRVGALRFPRTDLGTRVEAAGVAVQIVELGRDRLVLRATQGGDRVLGARAFNESGKELMVTDSSITARGDGSVDLEVQARGVPRMLDLRYAEKLETAKYPFTLRRTKRQVARSGS